MPLQFRLQQTISAEILEAAHAARTAHESRVTRQVFRGGASGFGECGPRSAIDRVTLPLEHHPQAPAPVGRILQMQLVELAHQGQVLLALRAGWVVVTAAADFQ